MPLKDRKKPTRLTRAGIIRLGHKEKRKRADGTEYEFPVQDNHFQLHDAPKIQEFYGPLCDDGEVREIRVALPFADPERNFDANYNVWAGGVQVCKGDGEFVEHATPFTAETIKKKGKEYLSVRNAPGDTLVSNGMACIEFDWNGEHFNPGDHVPCSGASQDLYPHCKACKMTAILKVMMVEPELIRLAYYQIATGSGRNYDTIMGTLEPLYEAFRAVNGIKYTLRLVEEQTIYQDTNGLRKKTNKWFLQLEPDAEDVRRMYEKQREALFGRAQIPAATSDEYVAEDSAPPPFAEDGGDTTVDTVTGEIVDWDEETFDAGEDGDEQKAPVFPLSYGKFAEKAANELGYRGPSQVSDTLNKGDFGPLCDNVGDCQFDQPTAWAYLQEKAPKAETAT